MFSAFFFNDTATTEIYTLSLHDALPISKSGRRASWLRSSASFLLFDRRGRSEEHTSELQSHSDLVCRLLLEKKKDNSLPYCMAVGLVDGMVTPLQFQDERVKDQSLIPVM